MCKQGFIVIGNYGLDFDPQTGSYLSDPTGLSLQDFFKNVSAVTMPLKLKIVEVFDESVVYEATDAEDYSFANINAESLDMMQQCEYGTYAVDVATHCSSPAAKSEILVGAERHAKCALRYDA